MPEPKNADQIRLGYGDRLNEDGGIEQFAILSIFPADGQQADYELAPETLADLQRQVDRVSEALASLRRREARRLSRSRGGWRQGQSH